MPLRVITRGSWAPTEAWLHRMQGDISGTLEKFGQMGVEALQSATPVLTGATAAAWSYRIERRKGYFSIQWVNTREVDGTPLVILLQHGHGTRQGGYVQGRDFINPAIRPIFDQIDNELRRVVKQ